jgi:hypothetical protein
MKAIAVKLICLILVLSLFSGLVAGCSAKVQISDLNISPSRIATGQKAGITASVTNPNKGEEKYSATLKINENNVETKEVTLAGGEKKTLNFSFSPYSTGTFKIDLNGLIDNLSVVNPPEFQVTSLDISPAEIIENSAITISAEIKNIGEIEGSYTAKLKVDGLEASTKDIKVGTESPGKVEFTSAMNTSGSHTLEVGEISKTVKVLRHAGLLVNSVKVTPDIVFPGQDAEVQAILTNTGEVKEPLPVSMTINGLETDSKMVSIEPGVTGNVAFKVNRDVAGNFEIGVKNLTAILKVLQTKSYTSPNYKYSISYPSNWILDDAKPESVSLEKPDTVYTNIRILDLPIDMTQKEFVDIVTSSNKNILESFKVLPDSFRQYRDNGATIFDYSYSRYGVFVQGNCFVLKSGKLGYIIFCDTLAIEWDENETTIDALLSSFKLR